MHRISLLFVWFSLSLSLSAQVLPVDEGMKLLNKIYNHPVISKDMTTATEFLEYRVYIPKYDYSKPLKKRIVEVLHQMGGSEMYLYDQQSDTITRLNGGYVKKSSFEISYASETWGFLCSSCFAQVTVD
jgi:hypothetical protein